MWKDWVEDVDLEIVGISMVMEAWEEEGVA